LRLLSLLRTQAFRIVLIYVVMFAVSVAAIVAFTYWNTARALNSQTDQIIEAEITGLSEQYQRQGLRGLTDVIIGRSVRGGQGLYLLADASHRSIAGNLDGWPGLRGRPTGFIEFAYQRRAGGQMETRFARGKIFMLVGGFQLLVARDVHERYIIQRLFTTTLPWSVALMLLIGLIGGGILSRNMLARLDTINRTSREIMAGDLSRRVPVHQAKDEFDTLSANLNLMLDRIERLMRGMREVTDSVAHDLRSPLNRLRNRLEALQRHHEAEDATATEIEAAIAETDRLIGTFNALLLIAEADAGTVREAMTVVDLNQIAEDVVELYGPLAEEKDVRLTLKHRGAVEVQGNRRLIAQAAANLIDNAIKYTPAGGAVHVSAKETPRGTEFRVSDTGPGIAPGDRARVIERFVRLEASRNSPGTGLGLSLVAAVARMHNAQLLLEDNEPGLKAVLRFSLVRVPLPANEPARARSRQSRIAIRSARRSERGSEA
jgi:signal transduction histidine kinase